MTIRSTTRSVRQQYGLALAWRPDWWVVCAVVLGWILLLATHPLVTPNHAGHHGGGPVHPTLTLADWVLMSAAMMVPVTLPAVRHVAYNSIRRRREWAMLVYLVAYLAIWVGFGVLAIGFMRLCSVDPGLANQLFVAAVLLIAAGWQLSRTKRRAILACRRTVPLPPQGWRADSGCLRLGLRQGRRCVVSCWPAMLVMAAVADSQLIWMGLLAAVVFIEERTRIGRRHLRLLALVFVALAGLALLPISMR